MTWLLSPLVHVDVAATNKKLKVAKGNLPNKIDESSSQTATLPGLVEKEYGSTWQQYEGTHQKCESKSTKILATATGSENEPCQLTNMDSSVI
jgi:hypothetical protein